jgi:two-component system, NtrC family, response regulator AtoC
MWLFPRPSDAPQPLALVPGNELLIGRDEGCGLRLNDPDVSRRHARIQRDGFELVLNDLNSRNGTFVNAHPIQRALLVRGDVVRLGGSVALVTDTPGPTTEIAPGLLAGPLLLSQLEDARRAAVSDLPIILEGETGSGKEVVARSIHAWSERTGPYLAVNCAALPEALAEGELFGYRKGAFTGADRSSLGLFRSAHGGTLLLDEVCDLPLLLQAKLLRVLEQREVQPLGEASPVPIDTRIIVATQEPLREVVARRQFRQDLFARLDGVSVRLPPLRQRTGDVPALFARAFMEDSAGRMPALEAEFIERLCVYDWPFNVREVVLLARRLRVLCGDRSSLEARDLPGQLGVRATPLPPPPSSSTAPGNTAPPVPGAELRAAKPPTLEQAPAAPVELPALLAALRASAGNVARAASLLGITRQRAYRLMQGQVDLGELRDSLQGNDA